MGSLSDIQIRTWVKNSERFDARSDGDGLYLRFRRVDTIPVWRSSYRFAGKQRVMNIGTYGQVSLAAARRITDHEERTVKALLDRMTHLSLTPAIEELTIQFRRQHRAKLPDAIISATAQAPGLELLTLDKKLKAKL
ncbi:MAG: integrase arm-type DNA-binding domain-containing protein [Methylovulum sp.]|uniref:integrase arm-type DNA-binding domain-containing protein n=1 Tax=Methylovulum sp. TaxID=1916980 RepID=UPI00261601C7|nr:integrase arm-type DNA-binding domain-containing protein [Methylovulum sp.]MDD2723613.1 integrase arm-type DNA-binding domain-containing protein [Methylovulum sp.]MDD5124322.1 integrase arm-type DNA-binding domain-containing protein [Methylovulum sp.]